MTLALSKNRRKNTVLYSTMGTRGQDKGLTKGLGQPPRGDGKGRRGNHQGELCTVHTRWSSEELELDNCDPPYRQVLICLLKKNISYSNLKCCFIGTKFTLI